MTEERLRASLTIDAPDTKVFAILADPSTHAAIDGSGWVREPIDPEPLSREGQVFRMHMYHANHPDGHYQMANQLQVFDPPHTISWLPGQEDEQGELRFGGWTWHYELTAAPHGETTVTLTYDWSEVPTQIREQIKFPPFGSEHLTDSLGHLAELCLAALK